MRNAIFIFDGNGKFTRKHCRCALNVGENQMSTRIVWWKCIRCRMCGWHLWATQQLLLNSNDAQLLSEAQTKQHLDILLAFLLLIAVRVDCSSKTNIIRFCWSNKDVPSSFSRFTLFSPIFGWCLPFRFHRSRQHFKWLARLVPSSKKRSTDFVSSPQKRDENAHWERKKAER